VKNPLDEVPDFDFSGFYFSNALKSLQTFCKEFGHMWSSNSVVFNDDDIWDDLTTSTGDAGYLLEVADQLPKYVPRYKLDNEVRSII